MESDAPDVPTYYLPDLQDAVSHLLPGLRLQDRQVDTLQEVERILFVNGTRRMRPTVVRAICAAVRERLGKHMGVQDPKSWPFRLTNGSD
ncbi:MAG: hypothetical protein PHW10_04160 [Candidatus Peribacteraceae bacterium]|nr:hypothetical protein [Candidatus Peribacteraceae bacterium]